MTVVDESAFLTDEEIARLSPEELDEYHALLEQLDKQWRLHPKQQLAEDESQHVDELFYGGAAGGGKTDWMLFHAYELCKKYPGHTVLALRRTLPQLKRSLIQRSLEKFTDESICRYVVGEKEWRFKNGSTILFGFCDTEEDVRHYLSTEYDLIMFEELTEFTERQYMLVRSRNRCTARKRSIGIRPHTISASNPGQVGHGWVKKRFVTATKYGKCRSEQIVEAFGAKKKVTVAFVPARVDDNPSIDPDYIFNLAQLPEIEKRQYLYGDWDVFEGQYFTEFVRATHVVPPFEVPESWHRIRCIDYGHAKPFCCLWIAFDWDGNAYVYRELYATSMTAREQALAIKRVSIIHRDEEEPRPEPIAGTYADPSIWTKQGHGFSIAMMYRDAGVICKKAMNARVDGWSRVRDWLRGDGTAEGGPTLRIFDGACPNLVRTLPDMIHDKDNPEDLDTRLEDHAADTLRYGLMSRPPRKRKNRDGESVDPNVDDFLDELVKRRDKGGVHPVLGRIDN